MKKLKPLFLIFAVLIILFSMYIATKKSSYDVSRTKHIKAPISSLYDTANDYKTWTTWGSWNAIDSTLVYTFGKKTKGKGATYSWTSAAGDIGKMTTLEAVKDTSLEQEIDFGIGKPALNYWKFVARDNGTDVTWGMRGENNFLGKIYWMTQGGIEQNLGKMFDDGLNNFAEFATKKKEE